MVGSTFYCWRYDEICDSDVAMQATDDLSGQREAERDGMIDLCLRSCELNAAVSENKAIRENLRSFGEQGKHKEQK